MMNVLRLTAGFAPALFAARTGLPLEIIAGELAEARARGLLETAHGLIQPTMQGRRFLNDLLQLFLTD
jgi:oxygen-independent coproporphyrinogen-3 oxidase